MKKTSDAEILNLLSACESCKKEKLLGEDCSYLPEALIGSWHPILAIVGINPGGCGLDPSEVNETYVSFYSDRPLWEGNTGWAKGYIEAYSKLIAPKNVPVNDAVSCFNENAAILNIIKCATPNVKGISPLNLEKAKKYCLKYLLKQLDYMEPRIVLSHGRFACNTILDLLRIGHFGSCDVNSVDKIKQLPMNEISKEYVIADQNGRETLFMFNKHLSYLGPAIASLNSNIEEKRKIAEKFVQP